MTAVSEPASADVSRGSVQRLRDASRPHLLLPAGATLLFAFHAGGFFPAAPAAAAVLLVLLAAGRLVAARSPLDGWSRSLGLAAAAMALLAAWVLLSAFWSDAGWRAAVEFDRALTYGLLLVFMGSFARRSGDLDRTFLLLALAICGVAVAALVTRLAPATFPTETPAGPTRLSFPLTYWNALGAMCSIGIVLALHCAAGAGRSVLTRVLGAACLPALATALYFTFSRGAIIAGVGGVVVYVVLAHPRRLLPALPAVAGPAAFAVASAYGEEGLQTAADAAGDPAAGRLLATIAACSAAAALLRLAVVPLDRLIERPQVGRPVRTGMLGGAALAALLAVAAVAITTDVPTRATDEVRAFLEDAPSPVVDDQRDRLTSFRSNGRVAQWRVAWQAFEDAPITGSGAGTYRLDWEERREQGGQLQDAHGLFVETLGELGLPGLVLLLLALCTPIAIALRRLGGPQRHVHAAFLGAAAVLLVHAQVDWDWEMPAVFAWFFASAGIVCAAPTGTERRPAPRRALRLAAGVTTLLLALMPASIWLSQRDLDRATRAFKAGDCTTAVDASLTSLERFNARPEPFELLGYCDLRSGQPQLGVEAMRAARARDPRDWAYAYGEAVALAVAADDPRDALADARARNPSEPLIAELDAALRDAPRRRWPRIGGAATVPDR